MAVIVWSRLTACCGRYARKAQRIEVRMLSAAIRRRHVYSAHSSTGAVLRLQPHHSVCPHLIDGTADVHSSASVRRENLSWYVRVAIEEVPLYVFMAGE